jgi:hypothetical protein
LDHPVFISLDFATIIFFTKQCGQTCVQPSTWRTRPLNLCPPVTGWPSYNPRHRVPFTSPTTLRAPASTRDLCLITLVICRAEYKLLLYPSFVNFPSISCPQTLICFLLISETKFHSHTQEMLRSLSNILQQDGSFTVRICRSPHNLHTP